MASKKVPPPPKKLPSPRGRAVVNLTWLARAIEDGVDYERAAAEMYASADELAQDLRVLLKEVVK